MDQRLAHFSKITNIDFGALDLDAPLGELTTNGHQASLQEFLRKAGQRTLRQTMSDYDSTVQSVELVGTPDQVAGQMGEVMQEVGGDGFLFSMPNVSRRTIAEVAEGLVPALQRRGLVRTQYSYPQFRGQLAGVLRERQVAGPGRSCRTFRLAGFGPLERQQRGSPGLALHHPSNHRAKAADTPITGLPAGRRKLPAVAFRGRSAASVSAWRTAAATPSTSGTGT